MLSVFFNDRDLSDYCVIRGVPQIVAGKDETLSVEMDITIKYNIQYNLDWLNRTLFTREPKQLIIGDQPNRYIMAELDGGINMTSRFRASDAKLKFKSEDKYWRSTQGEKVVEADAFGRFNIDNEGTAPAVPYINIKMRGEAGFISTVAPNGFVALGNQDEADKVDIPEQEIAMNEEMDEASMTDDETDWLVINKNDYDWKFENNRWTPFLPGDTIVQDRITGDWVPDYNKLNIGTGKPKFTQWGVGLQKATNPLADHWNAWGFRTNFDQGVGDRTLRHNYRLDSKVTFEDNGGDTNGTGMLLIILMDERNRPITTTSIYNIDSNSNAVKMSAKVNVMRGQRIASKIIHEATFPNGFKGGVRMEKEGDTFRWNWDSQKDQGGNSNETFREGDTVYIKNSATHYWHYNKTRYSVASMTRGKPHIAKYNRMLNDKRQWAIYYQGNEIAWVNEEDLTHNRTGVGNVQSRGKRIEQFSFRSSELAEFHPWKVVIFGGTWGSSRAFSHAEITGMVLYRINGPGLFKEVKNQFQPGDVIEIDHATGEVLHNGFTYQGLIDYDSRFFDIDYGPNEIQLVTSDWAQLPEAYLTYQERWR